MFFWGFFWYRLRQVELILKCDVSRQCDIRHKNQTLFLKTLISTETVVILSLELNGCWAEKHIVVHRRGADECVWWLTRGPEEERPCYDATAHIEAAALEMKT